VETVRPTVSPGRVTADFFTDMYRLSGTVMVYKRRLIDVLGDRMTDYLDLVDVYVSRIKTPGDIIATYQKGSLVKEEISFILLSSEMDATSKERFYVPTRASLPIFVTVPSFEITGRFQWLADIDVKKVMATDVQKFLPVLEGTAMNALFPTVSFQGPVLLVNKVKVQVLCLGSPG
jgi:hypothetical protein